MGRDELDLLITCSPGNICYLNGYVSVNLLDLMFLAIPNDGDPIHYLWQFERGRAESSTTGSALVCWETGTEPVRFVCDDLARRGLRTGRVAVDTGGTYTPYDIVQGLLTGLDGTAMAGLIETVRLVKSPAEHELIRKAAAMTDAGVTAASEVLCEGALDTEIARAVFDAMLDAGSGFFCTDPIVCVGWRSGTPHSPRGGTQAKAGDPMFIEHSGVCGRYTAPIMRTMVVGEPGGEIQELADYSNACIDALIAAIKPGVLGSEIAAVGSHALAPIREKITFHDLFAYPVGIGFPPSWIENPSFYLSADNHNQLEAGMVFHLPLMLRVLGQYGAGFSEAVIVTESGAEVLSKVPRSLS